MTRLSRKLILIVVLMLCGYCTYMRVSNIGIECDGTLYLPKGFTETFCYAIDDNVAITNINGLANVYYNMAQEGYTIYNETINTDSIDVIFIKDGFPIYRYYYQHPQGKVTIFSSPYETSRNGTSYISVRKEMENGENLRSID